MLKWLAILGVLMAPASVGLLKGQTAPLAPPKQGVTKSDSGQSGSTQPYADDGKQPSSDAIAAAIVPNKEAPSGCDETCQQGRQNLAIQRKLEWFTGVLAAVGVLQVIALIWQTLFVRRTWAEIHLQAGWMKTQTEHMSRQADLMDQQTGILANSVAVSQKSADAAETSAKAAMGVAVPALMLSRFSFIIKEKIDYTFFLRPSVIIEVKNFGQSPAFLKGYTIAFTWNELPEEPEYKFPYPCSVEEVVDSGGTYTIDDATTTSDQDTPLNIAYELEAGKKHLTVYGYISYSDLFGSPVRYMKFSKRLVEFDSTSNSVLLMDHGDYTYTGQHENYEPPPMETPQKPN
jgi:hypothetical protein